MSIYGVLEQLNPNFTENSLLSEEQIIKLEKDTFTMADYDVNVFFTLFPEFLKVFEKQENKFNFMFAFHLDIAKHLFSYEEYDRQQILCISLYLAHNIELAIGRNKNIGNNVSLNSSNASSALTRDEGGRPSNKELELSFEASYRQTEYGKILYPFLKTIGKMRRVWVA